MIAQQPRAPRPRRQRYTRQPAPALLKRRLRHMPEVGAIVLECTNMPSCAASLRPAFGIPVYDIHSIVTWFHAGLRPCT